MDGRTGRQTTLSYQYSRSYCVQYVWLKRTKYIIRLDLADCNEMHHVYIPAVCSVYSDEDRYQGVTSNIASRNITNPSFTNSWQFTWLWWLAVLRLLQVRQPQQSACVTNTPSCWYWSCCCSAAAASRHWMYLLRFSADRRRRSVRRADRPLTDSDPQWLYTRSLCFRQSVSQSVCLSVCLCLCLWKHVCTCMPCAVMGN